MKEFNEGSDRVAAIMGSALVENHLMSAIRTALVDSFNDNVLFHDQGAPFGTFKARILAGRALGLFGEQMSGNLDIIRDIRNQFAHALLSIDFENEHLAARCMELHEYDIKSNGVLIKKQPGREYEISAPRFRYEHACWSLSILLLQKQNELLDKEAERLKAELHRLQNPRPRNALADYVAASIEGRAEDYGDRLR